MMMADKIEILKEYFAKEEAVVLAFLFGSKAENRSRGFSDWDIGVYFKPVEYLELEQDAEYKNENKIWSDLIDILETDDVDFVVLNRARPELVFSILNSGIPLAIKDRKLYLELLSKTHYEAVDFRKFAFEFWKISERSKSMSEEDKFKVFRRLKFLEKEWWEFDKFKKMSWHEYRDESDKRRNLERWIENLVMACLDIAKIILASRKELIPDSYKDTLKVFIGINLKFSESEAEKFSKFADFRNIIVHEYLDIKWKRIGKFIQGAERLYPKFIEKIKQLVE
jgi:uncharacterized protein YutE (UPF0331/DUF86 family)/predicted nucleotidyltransferase